ncbi:hypothetical protein FRC0431_01159 [Corynebacterium diphtheriae]|nr:hypothetical protein FRC0430_00848 [Corynebacterium diphtheriae]CAB0923161.1 hypothetical protein FRC0431_01159 [Corynebacterium diphtheriae]CAB0948839.1 hypothetical protein FRC0436_00933 [Corynebacterium diphtheriae]
MAHKTTKIGPTAGRAGFSCSQAAWWRVSLCYLLVGILEEIVTVTGGKVGYRFITERVKPWVKGVGRVYLVKLDSVVVRSDLSQVG